MNAIPLHPILVISADWQTRALLAAQTSETTGEDALSTPGVNEALELVESVGVRPVLLVADAGAGMTRADVERLLAALPDTSLVLVVSALRRPEFDLLRKRCAAWLVRPVSVGQIARVAAQVLADLRDPLLAAGNRPAEP